MIKKFLVLTFLFVCFSNVSYAKVKPIEEQRVEWNEWLKDLKEEMLEKGISKKTIKKAYKEDYFHEIKEVVLQDKKQAEFLLTSDKYINRLINKNKVSLARKHYQNLKPKYQEISDKYGVPLNYLISFWAIETHFGFNKGKYHLIDSLTNLSYKNRRSVFFKKELFNVLKIMDTYDLDGDKIRGSWAGAMGHFQFMPSTYNAYAVDFDGDGVSDIWDNFDDAIASAANYLSELGWKKDEPWGQEVILPWNFDYNLVGPKKYKKVSEWKKIGVIGNNGKKLALPNDASAVITLPDGRRGRAYITLSNFRRIMIWNRSTNYALAIVKLADYINNDNNFKELNEKMNYKLTDEDILTVQRFANRILKAKLKEDGRYGSKTANAVKKLQKKWKLPQDGMPDYQLLYRIKNFKSWADFRVKPQPRKPSNKTKA
ncbi:MAG: lytic murein transglycosylase [Alphaproteobacteria bacterium]|nr:lytic murein transglycosylase [Alphaproteobacteria bacterium]